MGNFSKFFIERPIFASVLAIIIILAGVVAGFSLPISQYPDISPPTVTISTVYPGASAETIAQTVAAPIEEQLSGAEGMLYFTSSAGSDGQLTITATFEVGTDVDRATFQLNNRVQTALPRLPAPSENEAPRAPKRFRFVERGKAEGVNSGESAVMEVEEQDAEQHQHGAQQGIEEELDGGIKLARPAPDADQQVHGHEHGFPENEEEEEIQGHEDAEHAGLQHQKPGVVLLGALLDGGPGGEDGNPPQQGGEHDEQERNAVDAKVVTGANGRNPVVRAALEKLEARLEALCPEHWHQRNGDQQAGEGKNVRYPANGILVVCRHKQEQDRAHQRRE